MKNIFFLTISFNCMILISSEEDYEALKLADKNVSLNEVTKAYRQLVLKWHPDKNNTPEAVEMFKKINRAYKNIKEAKESKQEQDDESFFGYIESFSNKLTSTRAKQLHHIFFNNIYLFQSIFTLPKQCDLFESDENNILDKTLKDFLQNLILSRTKFITDEKHKTFDIVINLTDQKNPLLNPTSLCFFLTSEQQIGIVYFNKKNLEYAFVNEKGEGDVAAYEFSPEEFETMMENYPIYLKSGILSGEYGANNIYGDEPIFTINKSKAIEKPETSELFDNLNRELFPSVFLDSLIDYLKNPVHFNEKIVVNEELTLEGSKSLQKNKPPLNEGGGEEEKQPTFLGKLKGKVFQKKSIPLIVTILGILAYFNQEKLKMFFPSFFSRHKANK